LTTENLQQQLTMSADGATEPWNVELYGAISYTVEWSGATAHTGELEIQVSLDLVNWACYGGTSGSFVLDAASGYQYTEVPQLCFHYCRLNYTANSETTGNMVIRTWGVPLRRAN
jgi:hypothetical protein